MARLTPPQPKSLEESSLHRVLVLSNSLQALPTWWIVLSFVIDSLLVGIIWLEHAAC